MIQISKILKQVPIFRMLSKENIDFIVERLKFKTFAADEVICKIGDPGDEMYIVISGKVKICIYNENDEEQVVANLEPGDYFGEMALLTGEPRSASVIAMQDSETFMLHKNDFDVILEKFPSISLSMGKIVSKRLRDTLQKATSMPKGDKISAAQSGPSGSLEEVSLEELISFCEANSVTGTMKVSSEGENGEFEFYSGRLSSVVLGDVKDDKALDTMLSWKKGSFEIFVRPLSLTKEERKAQKETEVVKSILITNNSLVVRKIIERAFKGLGYNVFSAKDISESSELLDKNPVDIIISDIKLPDGKGLDFIEKVRSTNKTPFIFITDKSGSADFENKLKEMGNAELTKTHEVSEIVKLVENML